MSVAEGVFRSICPSRCLEFEVRNCMLREEEGEEEEDEK